MLPSVKLVGGNSWIKNEPTTSVITEDDTRATRWFVGLRLSMPLDNVGPRTDLATKRVQANGAATKQRALSENIDSKVRGLFLELSALDDQLAKLRSSSV